MIDAIELLAVAIQSKQRQKQQRNGLDSTDHEMFRRALEGYQHTEIEIAEFRKRQPTGTCDVRASKTWRPNMQNPQKNLQQNKVDNTPKTVQQSLAVKSILEKLRDDTV